MTTVSPPRAAGVSSAAAAIPSFASVPLTRRLVAEGLGTAMLIAVVIGSGVHAHRLSGGDAMWTLLVQSLAGGAGLGAQLLTFGPVSGAHLNPAVTVSAALQGSLRWREGAAYVAAQLAGAVLGVAMAHAMYGMAAWSAGTHAVADPHLWWSEGLATFGLIAVGITCARRAPKWLPIAVAAYIGAGYWFTASSALANPALTLACAFTDGPSGIRPGDVPGYVLAQLMGMLAATPLVGWLLGPVAARPAVAPLEPASASGRTDRMRMAG